VLSKIGELYGALAKAIEIPLATANRSLNSNLQTVFLEDRVNAAFGQSCDKLSPRKTPSHSDAMPKCIRAFHPSDCYWR